MASLFSAPSVNLCDNDNQNNCRTFVANVGIVLNLFAFAMTLLAARSSDNATGIYTLASLTELLALTSWYALKSVVASHASLRSLRTPFADATPTVGTVDRSADIA